MRLDEITAPPTKVLVTSKFLTNFDSFVKPYPEIKDKLKSFISAVMQGQKIPGARPATTGGPLAGTSHLHLVHGKSIVTYRNASGNLILYDITDHSPYTTEKMGSRLGNYIKSLSDEDFTELDLQSFFEEPSEQLPSLSPEEKNQLDEIIYDLISGSGFYILKPAVERNDWSNFFEWLETDMPDLDHEAMFAAYGGVKQMQAFIIHNIVQFGKAKEYQETPLP